MKKERVLSSLSPLAERTPRDSGPATSRKGSRDERELQACGQQQVAAKPGTSGSSEYRGAQETQWGHSSYQWKFTARLSSGSRARVGKTDDRFDASWGEGQNGSFSHV